MFDVTTEQPRSQEDKGQKDLRGKIKTKDKKICPGVEDPRSQALKTPSPLNRLTAIKLVAYKPANRPVAILAYN